MLGLPKTIDCPNCHLAKMRMTRTWRAIFWTLAIVAAGFAFFWLPVITAVVWGLALHYFLWTTDRTLKCPQCGLKRPYDFETAEEYEEVRRAWPKTQPAQQPVLAGGGREVALPDLTPEIAAQEEAARHRAELKAAEKEAKAADKAQAANAQFRRLQAENRSLAANMQEFHTGVVEPSLLNLSDSLGLLAREPDTTFVEKDLAARTKLVVIRDTAYDLEWTVTTTVKKAVTGGRKVTVSLSSERRMAKGSLGQAVARFKRQSQIASRSKSFPLADLDHNNPLSGLMAWWHDALKEFAAAHTRVIAEEGR